MTRRAWLLLVLVIALVLLFLYWQRLSSLRAQLMQETPEPVPVIQLPKSPTSAPVAPELSNRGSAERPDTDDQRRFVKLDATGTVLPDTAGQWSCVLDNRTDLIWEVKQTDGGLQDRDFTFVWFNPDNTAEPSSVTPNEGRCFYIDCYTGAYQQAINNRQLCGWDGWRLPTQQELASLDHPSQFDPDIDSRYFPNTASSEYWSSTQPANADTLAISVDFKNGFPYVSEKRLPYRVRLVHSKPG